MKITASQRRLLVMVVAGGILLTLTRQANHLLAPTGVSLWLGGLLIAYPALRLNQRTGFASCLLLGFAVDAWTPLAFGTHALLFGFTQIVIGRLRNRFAAPELATGVIVALITNLILYVVLTFFVLGLSPGATLSGLRLLSDLVISQLTLAAITPWYFALQERSLALILRTPRAHAGNHL